MPPHYNFWRFSLILSSHLRLGLVSGFFLLGFPTYPVYASPLTHTRYMPCPSHSSRFYHPNDIGWAVTDHQALHSVAFPLQCYLGSLRPKYSPQHPILKHPQPTFVHKCEGPNFTPIQHNRQNYNLLTSSVVLTQEYCKGLLPSGFFQKHLYTRFISPVQELAFPKLPFST